MLVSNEWTFVYCHVVINQCSYDSSLLIWENEICDIYLYESFGATIIPEKGKDFKESLVQLFRRPIKASSLPLFLIPCHYTHKRSEFLRRTERASSREIYCFCKPIFKWHIYLLFDMRKCNPSLKLVIYRKNENLFRLSDYNKNMVIEHDFNWMEKLCNLARIRSI